MVVQHNMQAMNSNRMLGVTTGQQAKSTEKLSSGFKINRAADDAAGLSISEKMRKQIRGLDRASTNAQDGVSAVQTAEGALNEVQDMLQRMNELAIQSANGTNSETDRTAIQNEIDQLTTEIDRVSETTKFNETYLLKGDKAVTKDVRYQYKEFASSTAAGVKFAGGKDVGTDVTTGLTVKVSFKAAQVTTEAGQADQNALAKSIRDSGLSVSVSSTWDATGGDGGKGQAIKNYKLELTGDAAQKYKVVADTTGGKANSDKGVFFIQDAGGNNIAKVTVGGGTVKTATATDQIQSSSAVISAESASAARGKKENGDYAEYFDKNGNKISNNALNRYFSVSDGNSTTVKPKGDAPQVYDAVGNLTSLNKNNVGAIRDLTGALNLSLHVGADSSKENKISLNIKSMSSKSLGVNGLKVDGTNDTKSNNAIETIKEALQKVSDQRAELGAVQNRLEHTINNLDNVVENTQASESRIRDTDIADEMVRYSKNNILAQAGQSMLAQANQSTQGALSLLG
jgi:flagellin